MQVIRSVVKILDQGESRKRPHFSPPRIRHKVHLTESQMQDLVASYLCGSTILELAAQHDICRTTISKYLKQRGVVIRLRSLGTNDVALAISLYGSGLSVAKVAERIDCAPNTVRSELLAAGVEMRDTHGRNRSKGLC
jgi:transposase-like protein